MPDVLSGIAAADARLGVPFPLPTVPLPLLRWVEVHGVGEQGAEVEWNLDDTRPGSPGRLVLYVGPVAPPEQRLEDWSAPREVAVGEHVAALRSSPLAAAQDSLKPVVDISWRDGPWHLRLTAQGPWDEDALVRIGASVPAPAGRDE